ncbi:MAG: hypothetical protein ACLVJX_01060 [Merdibacter sp.]
MNEHSIPTHILVRGARVHNLKDVDVDIPLHQITAIAGVSGSGKSSLTLGVLYAEGSRRYLESLSTYTRRRMTTAAKAAVDEVRYLPSALALRQRPGVPGIRSTFGTGSELLNSLRLMFSRLASHVCPNGHRLEPSLDVAAGKVLVCPICKEAFYAPSAEELSFNSQGACERCGGTGVVRSVDRSTLVPDESLSIEQGAVAPWNSLMWSLMVDVCRAMGVRTDVPFCELSEQERAIVFDGPAVKRHILYQAKRSQQATELDFTYYNAVYTVENALAKVKDEKGMKRVEKFLKEETCPECHGTRLSAKARAPQIAGISLDEACQLPLTQLNEWVKEVPKQLPPQMRELAESICASFLSNAQRLLQLGLGYLTLDRSSATLSTGERQRMQLARAVRNRTSGVLYVLDEPSIGLHPSNIIGLKQVMRDLVDDGNTVVPGSRYRGAEGSGLDDRNGTGCRRTGRNGHRGRNAGEDPDLASFADRTLSERRCTHPGRKRKQSGAVSPGNAASGHRCDPYGAAAGCGDPERKADGGQRGIRFREDHARSGEPGTGVAGIAGGTRTAIACALRGGGRHRPCPSDRCGADRHQCAFDGGDLCKRAR